MVAAREACCQSGPSWASTLGSGVALRAGVGSVSASTRAAFAWTVRRMAPIPRTRAATVTRESAGPRKAASRARETGGRCQPRARFQTEGAVRATAEPRRPSARLTVETPLRPCAIAADRRSRDARTRGCAWRSTRGVRRSRRCTSAVASAAQRRASAMRGLVGRMTRASSR